MLESPPCVGRWDWLLLGDSGRNGSSSCRSYAVASSASSGSRAQPEACSRRWTSLGI